jgi:uncharacterized membrane protein YbhN (UPF0104 family)
VRRSEPFRASRLQRLAFAGSLLLAFGLLALTVQRAGPAAMAEALSRASAGWVAAIVLLTATRTVVSSWRLYAVTQPVAASRFRAFPPLILGSQFVGLILPGPRIGPGLWRAHSAGRRLGGGTARHLAPNLVDQGLLGASWLLVSLLAAAFLAIPSVHQPHALIVAALFAAPVGAGLVTWSLRRYAARIAAFLHRQRPGWRGRFAVHAAHSFDGFAILAGRPSSLAASLAGGLAFVALTALAQYAALRAVGVTVPPRDALLTVIAGGFAGLLGLTPAGIGATEAAQVATLVALGVPAGPAGAAVVLATGTAYVLAFGGGSVAFARDTLRR